MTDEEVLAVLKAWEKANENKTSQWRRKNMVGAQINKLARKCREENKTDLFLGYLKSIEEKINNLIVLTPDERRDALAEIGSLYVESQNDISYLVLAKNKSESFRAKYFLTK